MPERGLHQSILPIYGGKTDAIGGHEKKVLHEQGGGALIYPIDLCVNHRELCESKPYCLPVQAHPHFHGDSFIPQSYIINLIISNAWGKRLTKCVGFIYFSETKLLKEFHGTMGERNLILPAFILSHLKSWFSLLLSLNKHLICCHSSSLPVMSNYAIPA